MQLPCSHVFCRKCLRGLVQQNRHCALCRASIPEDFDPIVAPLHQGLEQVLMRQCTMEYMQRMEDVALEAAHLVRLRIGNEYRFLGFHGAQKHQWTLKVELEPQPEACLPRGASLPDLIKHVRFGLLPACRVISCGSRAASETERLEKPPSFVEASDGLFQVTATSPLSCAVPIVITWQDWINQPPLQLEHVLDFFKDGGRWDYAVDLHAALAGRALDDLAEAQTLQRQQTQMDSMQESASPEYIRQLPELDPTGTTCHVPQTRQFEHAPKHSSRRARLTRWILGSKQVLTNR